MTTTKTSNTAAKFPSFNWMRGVSGDKELSRHARFVGIRIALCDEAYTPSTIALSVGIKERVVRDAITALKVRGWLDDHGRPSAAKLGGQP